MRFCRPILLHFARFFHFKQRKWPLEPKGYQRPVLAEIAPRSERNYVGRGGVQTFVLAEIAKVYDGVGKVTPRNVAKLPGQLSTITAVPADD